MPKFIKLKNWNLHGVPVFVNVNYITWMNRVSTNNLKQEYTEITFVGGEHMDLKVLETPEEIMNLIA